VFLESMAHVSRLVLSSWNQQMLIGVLMAHGMRPFRSVPLAFRVVTNYRQVLASRAERLGPVTFGLASPTRLTRMLDSGERAGFRTSPLCVRRPG
jgi:hypothetical protein